MRKNIYIADFLIALIGNKKTIKAIKKIYYFFTSKPLGKFIPLDIELKKQKMTVFDIQPIISVVCPVFNTPEIYLRKMIESVLAQTYNNFELCLYDTSDVEHHYINEIISEYIENDSRVKLKTNVENKGISLNSNEAAKMASGEYIALMDHDDILLPNALFEIVKKMQDDEFDFIYTDEATFSKSYEILDVCEFKPDFNLDLLRSNNYICHFVVIKTEIFKKVNGFKTAYEGSQDHDLFLRISEVTDKIGHVPKILYLWRTNPDSFSQTKIECCIESGIKALEEHLARCGINAIVSNVKNRTIYNIKYISEDQK